MECGSAYNFAIFDILNYIKTKRKLPTREKKSIQINRYTKDIYFVFTSISTFFVYEFPFKKPVIHTVSPTIEMLKELKQFKIGSVYVVPYIYSTLLIDNGKEYVIFKRFDVFKNDNVYKYIEINDVIFKNNTKKIVNKIKWKETDKILKIKSVETNMRIISNSIKVYRN